jgi:L-xylulokinase
MEGLITIDIGSSRIKCTVFGLDGAILKVERQACELLKRPGGFVERDPMIIWDVVLKLLTKLDTYVKEQRITILGITCTGAGDGLLLIDGKGQPVINAISSLDTRSTDDLFRWSISPEASSFYSLSGENPYAGTPIALLRWLKVNQRERFDKGAHILFVKDWIKYCLTEIICTDYTDSSATLTLIDGTYSKTLFELAEVEEAYSKTVEQIPSHIAIGKVCNHLGEKLNSLKNVPVFSGVHDCTGSALGSGCFKDGDLCLIAGSWAGNDLVVDYPQVDLRSDKHWLIRKYAIEGKYLIMSSSPTAFVNLDWFLSSHANEINFHASEYSYKSLVKKSDLIVENTEIDPELCYHPYLFGSQLIPTASAGFNGMKPWHGFKDMLRAIYEGIGFNYKEHVSDLQDYFTISSSTICGGGVNSLVFLNILAAILQRDFIVSRCPETTSLGAFISAAIGIGLFPSYETACTLVCNQYSETIIYDKEAADKMKNKSLLYNKIKTALEAYWKGIS